MRAPWKYTGRCKEFCLIRSRTIRVITSMPVLCLGFFSVTFEAVAQQAENNWMREYVQLRVAAQNIRTIRGNRARAVEAGELSEMIEPRIVGGTNARPNDNPFQVALLSRNISDNSDAQFCGGTLVRPNFVVTAAHCSDFVNSANVQVLVNTRTLDGSGQRINVHRIVIHPQWSQQTFDPDVAVWELASDASGVPVASLANTDGAVGADLLATGWGRLSEGGRAPIDLQRVEVPLVARANCNDADSYNNAITDLMLCAGVDRGGIDSCQGDSGGPLTGGVGNSVLTGITSWGIGCARPNLFGVYTRVSNPLVRDFIIDTVGANQITFGSRDRSASGPASYYPKAQSFAHPGGSISNVSVFVNPSYNQRWQLRILSGLPSRGNERGEVDQTTLDKHTQASADVSRSGHGWVDFNFEPAANLPPGDYFIFMNGHDLGGGPDVKWHSSTPGQEPGPYTDGQGWVYVNNWSSNSNTRPHIEKHIDYAFEVTVQQ